MWRAGDDNGGGLQDDNGGGDVGSMTGYRAPTVEDICWFGGGGESATTGRKPPPSPTIIAETGGGVGDVDRTPVGSKLVGIRLVVVVVDGGEGVTTGAGFKGDGIGEDVTPISLPTTPPALVAFSRSGLT